MIIVPNTRIIIHHRARLSHDLRVPRFPLFHVRRWRDAREPNLQILVETNAAAVLC